MKKIILLASSNKIFKKLKVRCNTEIFIIDKKIFYIYIKKGPNNIPTYKKRIKCFQNDFIASSWP